MSEDEQDLERHARTVRGRNASTPFRHERQPLVRRFCRDHDVPYQETSLVDSYGQVLRYLRRVGSVAASRR